MATCLQSSQAPAAGDSPQSGDASSQTPVRDIQLDRDGPELRLAVGELHHYRIELDAGEYLRLQVEQRGLDVAVAARSPSDELVVRVDSPTGSTGSEDVPFVAAVSGSYRIAIETSSESPGGTYRLRVAARRTATDEDRSRAEAAWFFSEGQRLRRENRGAARRAAIESYRRASAIWNVLGESRLQALALNYLGDLHWHIGDRKTALAAYTEALEAMAGLEPSQLRATVLSSLGTIHRTLGDFEAAQRCYDEALVLFRRQGRLKAEAITLNNLGRLSSARGAMHEAQRWYETALEHGRRLADPDRQATALFNLGGVYLAVGKTALALDHLHRAREVLPPGAAPRSLARILDLMADVFTYAGEPTQALPHFERALDLYLEAGDRRGQAFTLIGLGRLYLRTDAYDKGLDALERALDLFAKLEDRRGRSIALHGLGLLFDRRGEAARASDHYQRSLQLARDVRYRNGVAETLFGLARLGSRSGRLDEAWAHISEALDIVEDLRSGAERIDLRTAFFAARQDYYDLAISIALALEQRRPCTGHAARAFELSERSRSRALLDLLADATAPGTLDPALSERERRAAAALNSAARRAGEGIAERQERHIRAVRADYQKVRSDIRRATRGLPIETPVLSLQGVQEEVLDAETLLLEYDLGREQSHLWAITTGSVASFVLPPRRVIEAAALAAHQRLAQSHRRIGLIPARQAAKRLSDLLLGPVADLLTYPRLLIVADGALQHIPFAALPRPSKAPGNEASTEPLLVEHEIVYSPSASVLARLRRELASRPPAPKTLAVLADPVFQPDDPRLPHASGESLPESSAPRPPAGPAKVSRFERLPFTRFEAQEILSLVDAADAFSALGFAASLGTVASGALADYRIVHFATHAVIDARHPELSGLALSQFDRQGHPQDGFVRLHEIPGLGLKADLVVLSACRTALGARIHGEGVVGLTQGFLQAGAAQVLVSLWDVNDQATAELLRRFYRSMLVDELSPAAALRGSQISMRQDSRWHPAYFWAGFVLQGEWRALDTQSGRPRVLESKPF